MTVDYAAGEHTAGLWGRVRPIIDEIERLPFLDQLAAGTLDIRTFTHYILQDGLYLNGYARAMSLLAGRTQNRNDSRFWASSAATVITEEEQMQQALLGDEHLAAARSELLAGQAEPTPSPTTLGYVSFLVAGAATDAYAVAVAGVLPCFWVYAHVGKTLVARAGELSPSHPYKTWIETYDSVEFDAATRSAVAVLEELFECATPAEGERMTAAFTRSCVYELHFWASAHARQGWEIGQFDGSPVMSPGQGVASRV